MTQSSAYEIYTSMSICFEILKLVFLINKFLKSSEDAKG